ncbi:hypothetical protein [Novosphingobium beihaiensis]|uniref:Ribosomal protein L7/L12 C-terminal domain-containing protein n=1 Tax=Novosphingobium beihaiensis TaxID=2930389 RepID=A0ABT0BTE9_9SPHN|nr:hypothetical protein [Novosphingobium beihaiensis]MCJ2188086.1 hypothetical protein [Novosphingobium beihaiensis]
MISVSWPLILLATAAVFVLGWIAGRSTVAARSLSGSPAGRSFADVGPALRSEIECAVAAGRKIEAIKLLHAATGMGLKASKDAVEAMERI